MAKQSSKHGKRFHWRQKIAIFMLLALTGYMFVQNLRLSRTTVVTSDIDELIMQRVEYVDDLHDDVDELSEQIDYISSIITDTSNSGSTGSSPQTSYGAQNTSTLLPAIHGPGITVTLDDSPLAANAGNTSGSDFNINDYVVHQQDVEAVINALWAGGAEAMMIQDQRVLSNSAIICSGNVLLLQGKQYSPPYTIAAIGPIEKMKQALENSSVIKDYLAYVKAIGLGWKVTVEEDLEFEQTAGVLQPLMYAHVMSE